MPETGSWPDSPRAAVHSDCAGWIADLVDEAGLSEVASMIATTAPLTTLGLAGDGDDLDVLVAVERSFGLSFEDEETSSWQTVGDFYEAVLSKLATTAIQGKCSTLMAFYDVRRFLRSRGSAGVIRPSTRLRDLTRIRQAAVLKALAEETETAPVPLTLGWKTFPGIALLIFGIAGLLVSHSPIMIVLSAMGIVAGWVVVRSGAASFGMKSVGDLSTEIARSNFAVFAAKGADARPTTIWRIFRDLLAQEAGVRPELISRQTRLLA